VTISSEEHEVPILTFSTIPGFTEISMGIVGEMLLRFPLAKTSCVNWGTVEITTTVDGGEIH
jgi:hypothetical protein